MSEDNQGEKMLQLQSSYNRESSGRSANRNLSRNLVEAVRQCKELLLSTSFTLE
jgi:hypothetical protein